MLLHGPLIVAGNVCVSRSFSSLFYVVNESRLVVKFVSLFAFKFIPYS